MEVFVKRIDKNLELPRYESEGAVGFDLICRENSKINPNSIALLPSNLVVKVPENYMLMLAPRSSLFKKKGLIMPNSVGIIDQDYCGDNDELLLQVYNLTNEAVEIQRGEKLGQGIFVQIKKVKFNETETKFGENRGGFGSTDK
ncbi:MAG: dUTP diphosphatase [Candidatus Woesearchaeota archaeon]